MPLKSPEASVALPSASKPLCTLDKWFCVEFRILKAGLFALDRIEIVSEMLLFCLGKIILCMQQRCHLVWHDWKAQTWSGALGDPKPMLRSLVSRWFTSCAFTVSSFLVLLRRGEKSTPSPQILKIPAQIFQSLVVVALQRQTQGMMTFCFVKCFNFLK